MCWNKKERKNVYFCTFSFSFLFRFIFLDGCVNILGACTFIKSALSWDRTSTVYYGHWQNKLSCPVNRRDKRGNEEDYLIFKNIIFRNLPAECKVADIRRRREKNSSDCLSAMTRIGLKKDRYSNVYRDEHCIPTHTMIWYQCWCKIKRQCKWKAAFASRITKAGE